MQQAYATYEGKKLSITQAINLRMIETRKKKGDLAAGCGWSNSNVSYKMSRNKYSLNDLEKIAEVLGCELSIDLIPKAQGTAE